MKKLYIFSRIALGFIFLIFPISSFLAKDDFGALGEKGRVFIKVLEGTGYLMESVFIIEVVSGLLLLMGVFVPFGLVLLLPIIYNIYMFHFYLDGGYLFTERMFLPWVLVVLFSILVWRHHRQFLCLFKRD